MSYEKLTSCPVCEKTNLDNALIVKDHFYSGESFVLNKCESCTLLFTNPRPTAESISEYYNAPDYISHGGRSGSLTTLVYKVARSFALRKKEKLLWGFSSSRSLLDVGCGTGDFIAFSQQKGWEVYGIEPNGPAAQIAEKKITQPVYPDLAEYIGPKVGIITFWHVLEHIHNLNDTLKRSRKILDDDGVIIVALPNHESWDAAKYGEFWAGWDVPRHLFHFNRKSVEALARNHKLRIEKILPMKLDSYYVSLLSERYLGNGFPYIKALMSGKRSNRLALKNNNFSSLIYILKNK